MRPAAAAVSYGAPATVARKADSSGAAFFVVTGELVASNDKPFGNHEATSVVEPPASSRSLLFRLVNARRI